MGRTVIQSGSNPFSTRAVRPGAMRYRFPPSVGPQLILARLADHGWWGEITGPHGSGKTTLLETLSDELQQRGRQLVRFTLHPGQTSLRCSERRWTSWGHETQILVDGYEQLRWTSRWLLKRRCRRRGSGLLVTAHRPVGLPPIFQTQVTRKLAREIAQSLLAPDSPRVIHPEDIDRCYDRHRGNLRETLFALYDLYEEVEGRELRVESQTASSQAAQRELGPPGNQISKPVLATSIERRVKSQRACWHPQT